MPFPFCGARCITSGVVKSINLLEKFTVLFPPTIIPETFLFSIAVDCVLCSK